MLHWIRPAFLKAKSISCSGLDQEGLGFSQGWTRLGLHWASDSMFASPDPHCRNSEVSAFQDLSNT